MRSVFLAALLVPLFFGSVAQARPTERVSRKRTVHVSATPGETLPEMHVAGGTATVVTTNAPLGAGGPRLQDERGLVRLIPVDGSSFIVLPSADLPESERLVLTVPLQSGDSLSLALVTRHGEVDGEVRLVQLRAPADGEEGVGEVARLLNAASEGQVVLVLPKQRVFLRGGASVQVESVLRIGQYLFVTLSTQNSKPFSQVWRRLRLRVVLEEGSSVELPLLLVSAPPANPSLQHHTLVTLLPGGAAELMLVAHGEGREAGLSLPLGSAKAAP